MTYSLFVFREDLRLSFELLLRHDNSHSPLLSCVQCNVLDARTGLYAIVRSTYRVAVTLFDPLSCQRHDTTLYSLLCLISLYLTSLHLTARCLSYYSLCYNAVVTSVAAVAVAIAVALSVSHQDSYATFTDQR